MKVLKFNFEIYHGTTINVRVRTDYYKQSILLHALCPIASTSKPAIAPLAEEGHYKLFGDSKMRNDQAFPLNEERWYDETQIGTTYHEGLTKREYFAGQAMSALLTAEATAYHDDKAITISGRFECIANESVAAADALLVALSQPASKLNEHGVDEAYEAAIFNQ